MRPGTPAVDKPDVPSWWSGVNNSWSRGSRWRSSRWWIGCWWSSRQYGLGLPLSIKKLTKDQIQPIIDKIADQLPRWKADLMTKVGRVVQVQHVLTAMLVYLAMAIELPPWAIKAIDKIRRAFLWRGRKEANGGHCLIAWPKVCRSKELGGLGIADLKSLGFALRARWPWLRKSEPSKPWASLPFQVSKEVDGLISMAVYTDVGNGASTLFWKDRWLEGKNIEEVAPKILSLVSKRIIGRRTVAEALTDEKWIDDIRVGVPVEALMEYLELWDKLSNIELQDGAQDRHIWRLSASGKYTAKSAYDVFFQGAIYFRPYERIWKSWAPPKCRFFMWLVAHKRCWTADRLARRGLPHPAKCLLCDQEQENIDHLLVGCVFARQFWFALLQRFGLSSLTPQPEDSAWEDWWEKAEAATTGDVRKGLNSIIILGAWSIWKHRNDCVFNGVAPNINTALSIARDDAHWWCLAGAKGLSLLTARGA